MRLNFFWDNLARSITRLDGLDREQKLAIARRAVACSGAARLVRVVVGGLVLYCVASASILAAMQLAPRFGWVTLDNALMLPRMFLCVMVLGLGLNGLNMVAYSIARARIRRGIGIYRCPACEYPFMGLEATDALITCPECAHRCDVHALGIELRPGYSQAERKRFSLWQRYVDWYWSGIPALARFDLDQKRAIRRAATRVRRMKPWRGQVMAALAAYALIFVPLIWWTKQDSPALPETLPIPRWIAIALAIGLLAFALVGAIFAARSRINRQVLRDFPFTICSACGTSLIGSDITRGCVICTKCHYITNLALHGLTPSDLALPPGPPASPSSPRMDRAGTISHSRAE